MTPPRAGSRPASTRTWNPLHTPKIGLPAFTKATRSFESFDRRRGRAGNGWARPPSVPANRRPGDITMSRPRSRSADRRVRARKAYDRCRLEPSFDVPQDAFEDHFPVAVDGVSIVPARPIRMQVAEEASLGVRLHSEHVPVAVAQRRDVEGRPARVPREACVLSVDVDEPEDNLVVVHEFPQHRLLAAFRQQELPFRVRGDERDDATSFQAAREDARPAVFEAQEAGPAFVVARVVRREDRLRFLGHDATESGEQARLHEDLEPVAYAEDRLARFHEGDEVFRER